MPRHDVAYDHSATINIAVADFEAFIREHKPPTYAALRSIGSHYITETMRIIDALEEPEGYNDPATWRISKSMALNHLEMLIESYYCLWLADHIERKISAAGG
jgi:hypothetical protein